MQCLHSNSNKDAAQGVVGCEGDETTTNASQHEREESAH